VVTKFLKENDYDLNVIEGLNSKDCNEIVNWQPILNGSNISAVLSR